MVRSAHFLTLVFTLLVLTGCVGDTNDSNDPDGTTPTDPVVTSTPSDTSVQQGLSLDEAKEIASFDLLVPDPLPAGLELVGVDIYPESETTPIETVDFFYQLIDGDMPDDPITFQQRTVWAEVRHGDSEQVEIGGRTITTFHTAHDENGNPLAIYAWSENNPSYLLRGPSYLLSGRLAGDVTENHLVALIEALPEPDLDNN